MRFEVFGRPSYSALKVELEPGESITAEPGAMMVMKGDVDVEVKVAGGLLKGLLRKLTVGEALFSTTYKAGPSGGTIWLVPPSPGDIGYIELKGGGVIVQDTCYLAHHGNLEYDVVWRGFKGVFTGGGLFWLRLRGNGGVWVSSYGALVQVDLKPGEQMTVDNLHFVAMDDTVDYSIRAFGASRKLSGLRGLFRLPKSFLFGGEWWVCDIKGPGRLYLQTRNLPTFADVLRKFLPGASGKREIKISLI